MVTNTQFYSIGFFKIKDLCKACVFRKHKIMFLYQFDDCV